jgi:hypothetical protein
VNKKHIKIHDEILARMNSAALLLLLLLAYAALCFVALHRPDWLPGKSIFDASLVGPPHWLVWGAGARSMFWGSTFAMAAVVIVGASFRPLLLPCAYLCFFIWLGSGFLSVAMSI